MRARQHATFSLGTRKTEHGYAWGDWLTEYVYDTDPNVWSDPNFGLDSQYMTRNNRLLLYREYDPNAAGGSRLLRTVRYTYYVTGHASNITIKDEDPNGGGSPTDPNNPYNWYHDLALYYALNDELYRAVWDTWRVWTNGDVLDYTALAARAAKPARAGRGTRSRPGFRTVRRVRIPLLTSVLLLAFASQAVVARQAVQFVVLTADAADQQPPQIHLACSADGWDVRGQPLDRVAPGLYAATFEFERGIELQYKFTRTGSWSSVEKGADGRELGNRVLKLDPGVSEQVVVCRVERWADRPLPSQRRVTFAESPGSESATAPATAPTSRASTLTGDIRFHFAFHAPQLGNDRTLIVYLPPGYNEHADERYPVLYMHDGNNVFDAATSFAGEWNADETAQRLIGTGKLPKLVIVGIYNTPERIAEYTPFRDAEHGGGRGDAYLAFVVDTVKPFIDKTYRTQPDREHTGIAGSSLGGLISLYAACKYPNVFGCAGVISPAALAWANGAMLTYVRAHKPGQPVQLWIDVGTEEGGETPGETRSPVRECRELVRALEAAGLRPDADFHYEEIRGGQHNEADWSRRFDRVLLFLFAPKPGSGTAPAAGTGATGGPT